MTITFELSATDMLKKKGKNTDINLILSQEIIFHT